MIKLIIICTLILFTFPVMALDIDDCLTDAEAFGNHNHSIMPNAACLDHIKAESSKIVANSSDNVWKAYAFKHMLYLEKYSGETMISRELLAGDQTELKDIKSIQFDVAHNKLLILQQGSDGNEYLSFNLDFVGNVSPKTFLDHTVSNGAQSVSLSVDGNELKLHFPSIIKVYASTADSRYKDQRDECKIQLIRSEAP